MCSAAAEHGRGVADHGVAAVERGSARTAAPSAFVRRDVRGRACTGPRRAAVGIVYAGGMAWATRRGLALALVCAPACARGVSLEGSGADETFAVTDMGTSQASTPTEPPAETTAPETTIADETSGTTGADVPTSGSEGSSGGDESTTGVEGPHPELYPYDRVHSPITAFVAERMRAVAPTVDTVDARFAKIGGTTTANPNFQQCLGDDMAIMEMPPDLLATRDFFNVDLGAGITPYTRDSMAAVAAASSAMLVAPVEAELTAIHPRFAHVLVGTHDLASDQPAAMFTFAENLMVIVDSLIAGGAVPILSTLPQRTDMPAKTAYIPRYNAIIRGVAQGRQIPLVDLELALRTVPMSGLGPDGIDLSAFVSAMVDRPCFFNEVGLQNGYNVRNLESLVALDRAKRVVINGEEELDAPQPGLQGSGTVDDPFEIPGLPFVDMRTTTGAPSVIDSYSGVCDAMQDESGPEVNYHLDVDSLVNLRVLVFDPQGVDVDIHVLDNPDPSSCLKRNDKEITGPLPEGDYTIVVDTFAGDFPGGLPGEYILVVLAE